MTTTFQVVHACAFEVIIREQAAQKGHMEDRLQKQTFQMSHEEHQGHLIKHQSHR